MKKENYLDRLYEDVFPNWLRDKEASELEPRCTYCGIPVDLSQQFCDEQHEYLFYEELNLWADREDSTLSD